MSVTLEHKRMIDCTTEEYRNHLEKKFTAESDNGYGWERTDIMRVIDSEMKLHEAALQLASL